MKYRRLCPNGPEVSVLTLSGRGLDGTACPDLDVAEASAALGLAIDYGVNALAVSSAGGAAQGVAADLLKRERRGRPVHILSQVKPLTPLDLPSPHLHANLVFPGRHIRASTEASLKALGVEQLALQQLPQWCAEWGQEGDWLETFHQLKAEGKIAAFGVATFDHDAGAALDAVAAGVIDCVRVMYNIFDPQAAVDLIPLCLEKGVSVVARSPLYAGALSDGWGAEPFPADDWRGRYFYAEHLAETRERAAAMAALVASPDRSVSDLALRFSLSQPAIATTIIGMRSRAHVEANIAAAARGPLAPELLEALAAHKWLC